MTLNPSSTLRTFLIVKQFHKRFPMQPNRIKNKLKYTTRKTIPFQYIYIHTHISIFTQGKKAAKKQITTNKFPERKENNIKLN